MKRTIFAAALSFMAAAAAFSFEIEKPFFSGTTGFFTTVTSDPSSDGFDPKCIAESYFAGLFDFSGKLFLRGEFYLISQSMFESEILDENASFRIEEISATYKATGDGGSHYYSIFKGNYEPFGSDIFLQRQFGISKINSDLTESYHGIEGASVFPQYATGFSYTYHSDSNKAVALTLYKDKEALASDLRLAGVFEYATVDAMAGLAFPNGDEDNDSLLSINEVELHAGINALFGQKKSFMLQTQIGVNGIYLKKEEETDDSVNIKNFHILVEPRIPLTDFYFNPAVFNFPINTAADMVYLRTFVIKHPMEENVMGFNLNISNENLYIGTSKISAGIHGTIVMTEIDNGELFTHPAMTVNNASKTIIITPYASMDVFGGIVTASLSIDAKEFTDEPAKAFSCSAGFRTSF